MKLPTSIKWRLQLWYGLILVFVLSALGFAAYSMERSKTYHDIDDDLKLRSKLISDTIDSNSIHGIRRTPGPPPRKEVDPEDERSFNYHEQSSKPQPPPPRFGFQLREEDEAFFGLKNPGNFYYILINRTGTIRGSSDNAPQINIEDAIHSIATRGPRYLLNARNNLREFRSDFRSRDVIIVGKDISAELIRLRVNAIELVVIGAVVLGLGLIGGWWIADYSLKPIKDISRAADMISASDLSQRINIANNDQELSNLASILNATFSRLETAFNQQKQFAYDAAHELRTPVTIILTQTQSALKKDRTAEDYKETVEACLRAAERMKRLIESLLELARFDSGQEIIKKDRVNINELINDCIHLIKPYADERHVSLSNFANNITVKLDYEKISRVLINLINNSIQYNCEGGSVEISAKIENNLCVIEVKDTGSGISEEKINHIFERFYRADTSRSSGNAGLGLSLCKAIVLAHGGSIDVQNVIPRGCMFKVVLINND